MILVAGQYAESSGSKTFIPLTDHCCLSSCNPCLLPQSLSWLKVRTSCHIHHGTIPNQEDNEVENPQEALSLMQATILSGITISQVASGEKHTLALSASGCVWGWGWNGVGACGLGREVVESSQPRPLAFPCHQVKIAAVEAGLQHSLLLSRDGDAYSFGWNRDGQLGQGDLMIRFEPSLISELTHVVSISCGGRHSLALCGHEDLSRSPKLYTWGWNGYGQLGQGDEESRLIPTEVEIHQLQAAPIVATATASGHGGIIEVKGGRWHSVIKLERFIIPSSSFSPEG